MRRICGFAAVLGLVSAFVLGGRAQALRPAPARVAAVEYVLAGDAPARVGEVRLALGSRPRAVQIRLGRGDWIRCRVDGDRAACPVPAGEGDVEGLDAIAVVQLD